MKNARNNVWRSLAAGIALAGAVPGVQARTQELMNYFFSAYAPTPKEGNNVACQPNKSDAQYHQHLTDARAVYARCDLANHATLDTLWKVLADANLDGHVDKRDIGMLSGNQLEKSISDIENIMIEQWQLEQFYRNVASIFKRSGVEIPDIQTKESLLEAIRQNPELIQAFHIGWNAVLLEGIPFQFLLQYGENADTEWQKNLQIIESHPEYGNLLAEVARAEADLPRTIDALLAQGKITDAVHKQALLDLQKNIDSGEIKNMLLAQALVVAPELIGSYSSSHAQVSLQNTGREQMDVWQYKIKFGINAGVQDTSEGTVVVLMTSVGVKYQLDGSSRITANIGVNSGQTGVFPVAGFFYTKTLNQEAYTAAPLSDVNTIKTTASGWVGYGLTWPHIALGYREDTGATFTEKIKLSNELIETAFSCNASDTVDACMERIQDFVASDIGRKLDILDIRAIRGRLMGSQFDTATYARKLQILKREKKLVKYMYLEYLAAGKLGETKIALAGVLLGIFGIMPGVSIDWLDTENASDSIAQAHAHLLSQGYNTQASESMNPEEVVALFDGVFRPYAKVSYENGTIILTARNTYLPFGDDMGAPKNLTDELRRAGIQITSDAKDTKVSQNQIILPLTDIKELQLDSYYWKDGLTLGVKLRTRTRSNAEMKNTHDPKKIAVQKYTIIVARKPTTATPRSIGIGAR